MVDCDGSREKKLLKPVASLTVVNESDSSPLTGLLLLLPVFRSAGSNPARISGDPCNFLWSEAGRSLKKNLLRSLKKVMWDPLKGLLKIPQRSLKDPLESLNGIDVTSYWAGGLFQNLLRSLQKSSGILSKS